MVQQLLFADEPPPILEEVSQQVQHLRLEYDGFTGPRKSKCHLIEFKLFKLEEHGLPQDVPSVGSQYLYGPQIYSLSG